MIGSLKIQGKHSFVDPKDEEADKEDYNNNSRNDQAAVLNVYHIFDYKRDVLTCSRFLHSSTRPLVLAMSGATDLARRVKKAGEGVGSTYDEPKQIQM